MVGARSLCLCALLLVGPALAPEPVRAGVPRVCTQTAYDPIECPKALRRTQRALLPSARLRALDAQRGALARVGEPRLDRRRNRLLREIRDSLESEVR